MNYRLKKEVEAVLKKHNHKRARGNQAASFETQHKRWGIVMLFFNTLEDVLHYKLKKLKNIGERHITAVVHQWEEQGIRDLATRISIMRTFCGWIDKNGMVRNSDWYVKNKNSVRRKIATEIDKTWTGKGVDPLVKIAELTLDEIRVATILEVQLYFSLRLKEAMLMRPHLADRVNYLAVNRGTKGGRDRTVDILTAAQRNVIERAKLLCPNSRDSLIPRGVSFAKYRSHFYYVCRKHGISKKNGIVSHGLRHEFPNEMYELITGHPSPVKSSNNKTDIDYELDLAARTEISEHLGHSRPSITSAYCGPVKTRPKKKRQSKYADTLTHPELQRWHDKMRQFLAEKEQSLLDKTEPVATDPDKKK